MELDPARPIAEKDLAAIIEAARWAPSAHNMQNFELVVVDDPKLLATIGDLPARTSEVFIRENYEQLSFSEEELRRKKVGLLGTMFPESWRTPGSLDIAAAMKEPRGCLGDVLRGAPTLLVVTFDPRHRAPASEGDVLGMMSLGCVMENLWLAATALGIAFHVVSAVAGGDTEERIKVILAIPSEQRIAFAVRLGHPLASSAPPLRVRRDLTDFVHRNHYGKARRT